VRTTVTDWEHHHPPHGHPDFDAYLDTLTDDDLDAINTANNIANKQFDTTEI
jgi:hypothetical protein